MYCYPRYMGPSIFQTFAIRVSGYHLKTGILSSFDFIIFEWGWVSSPNPGSPGSNEGFQSPGA